MATKKARSSTEKQRKATVRKLEARLESADAKAARWKKKAKRTQAEVATLEARVTKLEKKLAKARETGREPSAPVDEPAQVPAITLTPPEGVDLREEASSTPDPSWTVVRLRAEARSRGLTGVSGKSKAELIAALA